MSTEPEKEKVKKKRETVEHMEQLQEQQGVFLQALLGLNYHPQLDSPCGCGEPKAVRTVSCSDCLQSELLCRQCWLNKHRTTPTHWALVWNKNEKFFEKTDFSRVGTGATVSGVPMPTRLELLPIAFCECRADCGRRVPDFEQLLRAGIFPGSVGGAKIKAGGVPQTGAGPKTGYTLRLLEYYHQERNQGKGSAYNFVLVLQRISDPFFAGSVPDIYRNFLAITRYHQYLDILIRRGHAHGLDTPLPGETERPYPNRPTDFMGQICAACPERGVNMPLVVNVPTYLRHLVSQHLTLDGNFKANRFYKRDDGSDKPLTSGRMLFPPPADYDKFAKAYVIPVEDTQPQCKAHIGSIRHQAQPKYGNMAVTGVVGCACDHAVVGAFIDMLNGEAFALGTYAQWVFTRRTNSPPHPPKSQTPTVNSYDGQCSYDVHEVDRAVTLFPDDTWFHTLLMNAEGQIPADHILGHGSDCKKLWQAVYAACRAHFHGETAEVVWAFLNSLGSSTRQMTTGSRHDVINFVMDAWNTWKVLRQAQLAADERLEALRLFELHMAVVANLSRQHSVEVVEWSRLSRVVTKSGNGTIHSVYHHESTTALTIEAVLASMLAAEQERVLVDGQESRTGIAQWIHDGIDIERQQTLTIALLRSHQEHPLQDTANTISKLRETLNTNLKSFRERQRDIYPRLTLSALDAEEPELTAIQLPSYRMKHGQRAASSADPLDGDLRKMETELRCSQANSGILAVRQASLALSAVKKARDDDYRGQAGITRSKRNVQKAQLTKDFEIKMYGTARSALIHLEYMAADALEPYPPLTDRDTRRKETHLHRAIGDSRVFDGTAWYLQSGETLSNHGPPPVVSVRGAETSGEEDEPQLLAGTNTLKRSGFRKTPQAAKCLKDIVPAGVTVESSASEAEDSDPDASPSKRRRRAKQKITKKARKPDGWVWLESWSSGRHSADGKLAEYQKESDRVQWFRAEAEMYRWLEQYERKHAELMRIIERFRRDGTVWAGLADREKQTNGTNGTVVFARMQASMYRKLEHNARCIFKDANLGAHHDWVRAGSFDELVVKIDGWRKEVFRWMDEMVSLPPGGLAVY
ncbi:hypothetical protein C8F01DRAFT_1082533 [Mycena amicta]|nr:hypothetical protein C8F01DRAFT_1082533 [Mycena amicta]